MVIGVLAKVVILTLAMQRCCNEFSGVLSVVAALFHRLLVSFISGLMGGHPVSNDQNPPTVVLLAATDKGNGGESMTPLKSQPN